MMNAVPGSLTSAGSVPRHCGSAAESEVTQFGSSLLKFSVQSAFSWPRFITS
jgi:hypothetical protein